MANDFINNPPAVTAAALESHSTARMSIFFMYTTLTAGSNNSNSIFHICSTTLNISK